MTGTNSKKMWFLKVLFVFLLMCGSFFLGNAYAGSEAIGYWQNIYLSNMLVGENQQIVNKVMDIVKTQYLGEIDNKKLFYGSLKGMVGGLGDVYSEYFTPLEAKDFWSDLTGEFEGIGIEIFVKDGMATVATVLPETPAEKAGIKIDDIIVAVDSNDIEGSSLSDVARMIKGKADTEVKLSVVRNGEVKDFLIKRDKLSVESVLTRDDGDLFYARIVRFDENTDKSLVEQLGKVDLKTKKGLIIDLRGNPGGYFDSSIAVADEFIKDGLLVTERNKNNKDDNFYAKSGQKFEDIPMAVIIDRGSASASEIVAGAIKDNSRGVVVGQRSYGKGSVQVIEKLEDGSALKLTIAEWLTPKGINLRKEGIIPDIETAQDDSVEGDEQYEAAKKFLLK